MPSAQALAEAMEALLAPLAAEHARWPLHVVLDDRFARLWQVTPPPVLSLWSGAEDLRSLAAMRLQQLYGENPADWQIGADWQALRPFVATALPRATLAALQAVAERHALWLASTRPYLLAAWDGSQRQRQRGQWLGLVHDGQLGLVGAHGQHLRHVRWQPLPAQADATWLPRLLAREALLQGLPAPASVLLCGPAPPWLQQQEGCTWLPAPLPDPHASSAAPSLWLAAAGTAA
ncbi:MAG: hypothetical protein GAK31_01608 [Stenotrophomonas maltophilia]|uniref:Uncharacterized protein n=1 Tax=Stenotrophomonas maltophilia TaxID=40324 RepID=A0A7V8JMF4_STEMA|nr:MAG: hypothetical protein GAK31_01608 [Stenotrophomonas maltophilia]